MRILITGANRGLGLALVKTGLEKGHIVFAGVRNIDKQNTQQLEKLQNHFNGHLKVIILDVTDEESIRAAVPQMNGKLDVIINNAGMLNERETRIEDLDLEACKLAFDINTFGPMRVTKHFLPLLRKGERQSIINISSDSASLSNASIRDYPYGLSKAALNMFSEKLHRELKEDDIQVVSIHPGWMHTDMGGEQAPTDPNESAHGIYQIIDERQFINSDHVFIDYQGSAMEL